MRIYVVISTRGCYTDYHQTNEIVTTNEFDARGMFEKLTTQLESDIDLQAVEFEIWEDGINITNKDE